MRRVEELCFRHLPLDSKDYFWRYHRVRKPRRPLVVEASRFSDRFECITGVGADSHTLLVDRGVQFKAPVHSRKSGKINSGICTVIRRLARLLLSIRRLGKKLSSLPGDWKNYSWLCEPCVPFDLNISSVYYRFGAFTPFRNPQLRRAAPRRPCTPQGDLVPDFERQRLSAQRTPESLRV